LYPTCACRTIFPKEKNSMNVPTLFQELTDKLQHGASVKSVFGEPISAEGKTIIPVAKIAFGFGGGLGIREVDSDGKEQDPETSGGGGGGGGAAMPVGVVEISEAGTRFVPIGIEKWLGAAMLFGVSAGFLLGKLSRRR
jgi:uncharacterized spore protein YtfJ